MIRIILVEDHTLVRVGIRTLLETVSGVQVIGEASDGREALQLARKQNPDVVLMDVAMKGLNGLDATVRLLKAQPSTRVIMLSMYDDPVYVQQAFQAGAAGYLLKSAEIEELERALKVVMRGETYLSPAVAKDFMANVLEGPRANPLDALTSRQREILQLIAEGKTTKDIADQLDLSVKTVEAHRAQIMDRLQIHELAGLVRFAIRNGLVTLGT